MRLNEGLLVYTSLDEEDMILLEKILEGFCFFLPVYKDISIMVPRKNSDELIVFCNIYRSAQGNVEINEGERIQYSDFPEIKGVLENNKGFCKADQQGSKMIFMPIERNHKTPFGVVRLICKEDGFRREEFVKNISSIDYMEETFDKCFSKLIVDAYAFMDKDGDVQSLNQVTDALKSRIRADGPGWFPGLWKTKAGRLSLSEIIRDRICTGVDFEIKGFEFYIILFPLYADDEYQGMLICFYDVSSVKNMLKEVINKSTVIKEVHHRVKNNLQTIASLLSLQTRRTDIPVVEKALSESINRITSIALVYEALSKDGANVVNMGECIKNIMSMILNNMVEPSKSIRGEIRGKEIYLNSSQASNVSLCINELIQNAVKHGFALRKNGNIAVTLNQVNQEVIITVEDDGVGLSGKKGRGNSMGLRIIQMITSESLHGSFKLESHTYGTIAEIRFHI
jgi:two-component system, sensor histidine kinase PdtaS